MKGQTAGAISAVVVLVIIASGFVPTLTTLNVNTSTYSTEITTSPSYTAVQTLQSVTTQVSQPYSISSTTLQCNAYADGAAYLNAGTDVQVTFSASGNLYLYVFNSAQYSSYNSSGTTSPNEGEIDAQSSGTTSFIASSSDTYYLVLENRPGSFGCLGVGSVGLYSATGSATYSYAYTYTTTETLFSVSSYSTILTSTTTKTCTLGWLQALFGCH